MESNSAHAWSGSVTCVERLLAKLMRIARNGDITYAQDAHEGVGRPGFRSVPEVVEHVHVPKKVIPE